MNILVNTSLGELIDKMTILEIKQQNIKDDAKLVNVNNELEKLTGILDSLELDLKMLMPYKEGLSEINKKLWGIEDDLRDHERGQNFDDAFLELARSVYFTNDKRAKIKKDINVAFGSDLVEEKSYQNY